MTQLRSCYFCGAVGDSLQEYDVVPDRLASADESRSAVLCSTCQEKLRRVLEPVLDAAEEPPSPDDTVDALDEVTFESGETSETESETRPDESEDAGESSDERPDESADADESDATPEASADGDEKRTKTDFDASENTETDDDLPEDYYRVLRLLQNREFPMERADLTAIVTGAYDVTGPQCERILETAVERGVLVEDGTAVDLGRN
ncbi:hypothetical protein SAMN04488065_0450 [Haloplanus vescus]|uniref:Uncharacterized protein n=1 Tax=Haloplanus vescus TaxID=555874 RepID=A0A1H3W0H6_9EURY|nr:hypothetical protein [Haloplanus vescus]SDZ80480.1 hypothetical protein SAMN04488065_0450 [Haloplanus vescus]